MKRYQSKDGTREAQCALFLRCMQAIQKLVADSLLPAAELRFRMLNRPHPEDLVQMRA